MPLMSAPSKPAASGSVEMAALVASRTMEKYAKDYFPKREQITISFRGDIAEKYNYDKIRPLSAAQCSDGRNVVIEGTSQKTGATAFYRIECNSWNLIEAIDLWDGAAPAA